MRSGAVGCSRPYPPPASFLIKSCQGALVSDAPLARTRRSLSALHKLPSPCTLRFPHRSARATTAHSRNPVTAAGVQAEDCVSQRTLKEVALCPIRLHDAPLRCYVVRVIEKNDPPGRCLVEHPRRPQAEHIATPHNQSEVPSRLPACFQNGHLPEGFKPLSWST